MKELLADMQNMEKGNMNTMSSFDQESVPPGRAPSVTTTIDSHAEQHFGNAEIIRDVIIGLSDGLTGTF